jgi:hypothetical protein
MKEIQDFTQIPLLDSPLMPIQGLLDLEGDREGLVSSRFFWGLQQTPTLQRNSVDFDQSVLSRMLALGNTAG